MEPPKVPWSRQSPDLASGLALMTHTWKSEKIYNNKLCDRPKIVLGPLNVRQ